MNKFEWYEIVVSGHLGPSPLGIGHLGPRHLGPKCQEEHLCPSNFFQK